MIKIKNMPLPLSYDRNALKDMVAARLGIAQTKIKGITITKRSVDAKDKQNIHFKVDVAICISGDESALLAGIRDMQIEKEVCISYIVPKNKKRNARPIIVGSGPAGLFAALLLAEAGVKPILLERGQDVAHRTQRVLAFWETGVLSENTNVQFGEGGAGTFSDGKLKIGMKDARKMKVLRELVLCGAPEDILYLSKPHIGTDRLRHVVMAIRKKIISLGGEVKFDSKVTQVLHQRGKVTGVRYEKAGEVHELFSDCVVLAIGHSARDTFKSLHEGGIIMEQKPFAIGLRIEHPQRMIDQLEYASFAGHPTLDAADYKMVVHLKNGRNGYTFCMCPGGSVIAAASEENGLTTNGMSQFARDGNNANCALLITVLPKDIRSDHVLAGMEFQRSIEKAAFLVGGGGYRAPVQRLEDFLCNRRTKTIGDVSPTYKPGIALERMDDFLPEDIADALRLAINEMELWKPGYAFPDALLTGVEARSSSPVRMLRGAELEAIGIQGLYPCGEGAGYAGGIISAAVDGVRCAERILGID